jgi:lipopolysaccharide biosynthesis glycosyltransferase
MTIRDKLGSKGADDGLKSIVLICDKNFVDYVPVLLKSLQQSSEYFRDVYIVHDLSTESQRLEFFRAFLPLNEVKFLPFEPARFIPDDFSPPRGKGSSVSIAKLFLTELISDCTQVLYLDIDIIILDSIERLLNTKLAYPIAAVEELGKNAYLRGVDYPYINSGVMLMDLERLRDYNFVSKVNAAISSRLYQQLYVDQEIINVVMQGNIQYLPQEFNVFINYADAYPLGPFISSPKIVHFVGTNKPWLYPNRTRYSKLWSQNYSQIDSSALRKRHLKENRYQFNVTLFFRSFFLRYYRLEKRIKEFTPENFKKLLRRWL